MKDGVNCRIMNGDINLLSFPCTHPLVESCKCPHSTIGSGIKVCLGMVANPKGRTVNIAKWRYVTTHCSGYNVSSLVVLVRSRLSKRRDGNQDYAGIDLL